MEIRPERYRCQKCGWSIAANMSQCPNCGNSPDYFERESKVLDRFIDNAKSYIQISSGGLLLSVTFLHEIVGTQKEKPVHPGPWLTAAWICWLVTILAGTTCQYFGAKFLEWKAGVPRHHRSIPRWIIQHPWPMYGLMLVGFYLGAILFTVGAITQFPR
jgi:hypothetical protein